MISNSVTWNVMASAVRKGIVENWTRFYRSVWGKQEIFRRSHLRDLILSSYSWDKRSQGHRQRHQDEEFQKASESSVMPFEPVVSWQIHFPKSPASPEVVWIQREEYLLSQSYEASLIELERHRSHWSHSWEKKVALFHRSSDDRSWWARWDHSQSVRDVQKATVLPSSRSHHIQSHGWLFLPSQEVNIRRSLFQDQVKGLSWKHDILSREKGK